MSKLSPQPSAKRSRKPSKKVLEAMAAKDVTPAPKRPRGRPRKIEVTETKKQTALALAPTPVAATKKTSKTAGASNVVVVKEEKAAPAVKQVVRKGARKATSAFEDPIEAKKVVDFFDDDFSAEPSVEFLASSLNAGLADGTIVLSDSDDDVELCSEDGSFLGPVTSTPFVRKNAGAAPKARAAVHKHEVKVSVHDGLAMRSVPISSSESLLELLEKICAAIKRLNHKVEMGYDAPWSSKIGSKKCVSYLSNADELAEFWLEYDRYLGAQKKKQRGKAEVVVSGIVFHNILDGAQTAAKSAGGPKGNKPTKDGDDVDARDSAKAKQIESAQKVQNGMFCKRDNRLCYLKYDGTCGAYTPDNVLEHSTLHAQGVPGVVPDKVPASMSSRLLDYVRPDRKARVNTGREDVAVLPAAPTEVVKVVEAPKVQASFDEIVQKAPLDYPSISNWLKKCEDDLERGRDKHAYTKLTDVFDINGCTRIDDIVNMTPDLIRKLATEEGVEVTIGLVHRVFQYAATDVIRVRKTGKLAM